jgi:serine/threonine protein phosphatase PrpC
MQHNSAIYSIKNEDKCFYSAKSRLYGIADGHGGDGAAKFCREYMCNPDAAHDSRTLAELFEILHKECCKFTCNSGTALTVCAFDAHNNVVCANVGDALALVVTQTSFYWLTESHRLQNNAPERTRLRSHVGHVVCDGKKIGPSRLFPVSCSRSIGDADCPVISAVPNTASLDADDVLVIVSDGLWDEMPLQKICRVARSTRCAQSILQAHTRQFRDDTSVIVVSELAQVCSQSFLRRTNSNSSISSEDDNVPIRKVLKVCL